MVRQPIALSGWRDWEGSWRKKADFQATCSKKIPQEGGTKESSSSFILIKSVILELQILYIKGDPNFIIGGLSIHYTQVFRGGSKCNHSLNTFPLPLISISNVKWRENERELGLVSVDSCVDILLHVFRFQSIKLLLMNKGMIFISFT